MLTSNQLPRFSIPPKASAPGTPAAPGPQSHPVPIAPPLAPDTTPPSATPPATGEAPAGRVRMPAHLDSSEDHEKGLKAEEDSTLEMKTGEYVELHEATAAAKAAQTTKGKRKATPTAQDLNASALNIEAVSWQYFFNTTRNMYRFRCIVTVHS